MAFFQTTIQLSFFISTSSFSNLCFRLGMVYLKQGFLICVKLEPTETCARDGLCHKMPTWFGYLEEGLLYIYICIISYHVCLELLYHIMFFVLFFSIHDWSQDLGNVCCISLSHLLSFCFPSIVFGVLRASC